LLSVRAEAERTVDPDRAVLHGQLGLIRGDKAEALQAAAVALDSLTVGLKRLGGVALTASTFRHRLTWSTQGVSTHPDNHPTTEGSTPGVSASVMVVLTVRDFDVLHDLEEFLAGSPNFQLQYAAWQVDADNPAWTDLRADAIRDAVRKGQDYAAALSASIVRVYHIADAGLLGGDTGSTFGASPRFATVANVSGGTPTPSLDPVPQTLVARIDARFQLTPAVLPPV
jgi:hypothetical protein